jgi:predicted DNA-binding protein
MKSEHTMSFRVEQGVHERFVAATAKLGINGSQVLREALIEKVEELEELATLAERLKQKQKRKKKPIAELWKSLGLDRNL